MEAVVLRVKRKRGADPDEALLISCKRLREEPEEATAEAGAPVTTQVFRLAATVSSQNEPLQKYVREAISRDRTVQMLRPSLGSTQRIQQDLRMLKAAERQNSRYRIVSHLRPTCGKVEGAGDGSHQPPSPDGDHLLSELNTEASAPARDAKEATHSNFQLFDMVQEELDTPPVKKESKPETILCNSVKMIREHLTVSDDSKGLEHREDAEEFVYDIYYAEASSHDWIQDILAVQPYTQEQVLVPDDPEPEEVYEDEDDENEESNWRNDYPDEEDSDVEERYEGYYEDSDEEDAWRTYRRHNLLEEEDNA